MAMAPAGSALRARGALSSRGSAGLAGGARLRASAAPTRHAPRRAAQRTEAAAPQEPLMVRALRGEKVERPPVWMMRQAGRYMQIYKDLCKQPHANTFRKRSETTELVFEISMQPYRAFKPDGVIMFSDILTPLTGLGVPFDILEREGPVVSTPIRSMEAVKGMRPLVPAEAVPYAGAALSALRAELAGTDAAVLGFVGAPFTLATYCVEGGTTSSYLNIKKMAFGEPAILHALLDKLTDGVIEYVRYQADAGAHVVQIFDSWGCNLSPCDWDIFSGPYIKRIVSEVKRTHPRLPLILYASGSGGMLERMAATGVDCVSVDQNVDMADARKRLGADKAVQGNLDPAWLFASHDFIRDKVDQVAAKAGRTKHVMNLGHGVMPSTPEANVAAFFEAARTVHERRK